ncbi:FAD-dependent oxidoreductase [Xanthobacteraceae bacterium Astr-EGSB]|uniref:FAD-dependent oxidoreductase n=1 Tax=Astrobacterium formosum TaxID=3069710 RepID=UPI0027AE1250|nr:FAD-dependent oxidoreductase [Xanthobacteraceae bacterium Astr-EGSB]
MTDTGHATVEDCDLAVIGTGPAGMAAAVAAAEFGLAVVAIDEQAAPGGQIYRNVLASPVAGTLGPDYRRGAELAAAFNTAQGISRRHDTTVSMITPEGEIVLRRDDGKIVLLRAQAVIIATGAMERPAPFPGWTLPGVMTAGSAQILLKAAAVVPADGVVLAGSGPLLYLVAVQLLDMGVCPGAIIETTPAANYRAAARHWFGALRGAATLLKGLGLITRLKIARVPMISGASGLVADAGSDGTLARLKFRRGAREYSVACRLLLVHQGVVPNTQISRALELPHDWDDAQRCWRPRLGAWGDTTLPGIYVAGDGGGIGGALAAEEQGRLAAFAVACNLGCIDKYERDRRAAVPRRALARHLAARPFLDALYRPGDEAVVPTDETVVCRCEEVTAAELRRGVAEGCLNPNHVKTYARPGMGPCQGRMCGLTVAEVIAAARGLPVAEVGHFHVRQPLKPMTLGEFAALADAMK